jgi:hypothetical protein
MLGLVSVAGNAADPCAGKVAATILAYDRDARQGAGLLMNYCGRAVKAELLVTANNRDGFAVARLRTAVQADAAPLSMIKVDLPLVPSSLALSGFAAEIASTTAIDDDTDRTAARAKTAARPAALVAAVRARRAPLLLRDRRNERASLTGKQHGGILQPADRGDAAGGFDEFADGINLGPH